MTNSSEVLVLVADEMHATLCANSQGETRLVRTIDRITPNNDTADLDPEAAAAARNRFACQLMMALGHDAGRHPYKGVIIFAEAQMMEELRRVQTSVVSRKLIAQIVGKPFENSRFPGRSAANAELAYRGGDPLITRAALSIGLVWLCMPHHPNLGLPAASCAAACTSLEDQERVAIWQRLHDIDLELHSRTRIQTASLSVTSDEAIQQNADRPTPPTKRDFIAPARDAN